VFVAPVAVDGDLADTGRVHGERDECDRSPFGSAFTARMAKWIVGLSLLSFDGLVKERPHVLYLLAAAHGDGLEAKPEPKQALVRVRRDPKRLDARFVVHAAEHSCGGVVRRGEAHGRGHGTT
jgi:hypothetical protein